MTATITTQGLAVADFIESFCRVTEGERTGETIKLASWQRRILYELFELRPDGRRKHREALIGLPRKNGKSSLGAGIALYLLMADGEMGAQVFSCAGDKEQARIVFGTAKKMVEMDPELSKQLTVYRDAIVLKETQSVYRVLSAEAYTKEGLNPSAVVFDELHVQPDRGLWDVMTSGSGTRRDPLILAISTAGFDLEGTLCGEKYQYGRKVKSGEIYDPTFYFRWYEPPESDCDYRDPQVWAISNPALGDFLYEEDLADRVKKQPENVFRRYGLNQWTQTESAWIPYGIWDKCREPHLTLDPTRPTYVGIDIAKTIDSSAVAICQPVDMRPLVCPVCGNVGAEFLPLGEKAEDGYQCSLCLETVSDPPPATRYVLRGEVWENPYPENHSLHDTWRMNNNLVKSTLRDLRERFPVAACEIDEEIMPGPCFAFDPWRFRPESEELQGEGLAMLEFPQSDSRMIPASQDFYEAIMKAEAAHDGSDVFKRHVQNVTADPKPRGWRMSKPHGSKRKIDWAIAAAIALHLAKTTVPPGDGVSAYEQHGILFI